MSRHNVFIKLKCWKIIPIFSVRPRNSFGFNFNKSTYYSISCGWWAVDGWKQILYIICNNIRYVLCGLYFKLFYSLYISKSIFLIDICSLYQTKMRPSLTWVSKGRVKFSCYHLLFIVFSQILLSLFQSKQKAVSGLPVII